jgi:ElaB/YqjD/DUF883 family membrane-anchored ribosome-binding protein
MNIPIHSETPIDQLPEVSKEMAQNTTEYFKEIADSAVTNAKDIYQKTTSRAGEVLVISKEYVRRNPVPVVLGAVALGATLGYFLVKGRSRTLFGAHQSDEPLVTMREAILDAIAPVSRRVHERYESAREGAGKVMDGLRSMGSGPVETSLAKQIGRLGNNLKIW